MGDKSQSIVMVVPSTIGVIDAACVRASVAGAIGKIPYIGGR